MKTYLVHTKRSTALTYDEHEGRLFMLHPYEFACEGIDGTWMSSRIWCDEYQDALDEAKFNAELFGTGRYRIYGNCHKHEMWRDENGMLHVTKKCWNNYGNNFKGRYSDFDGKHPELKGKRELMPPLELGYSTCLLIEGASLVIE